MKSIFCTIFTFLIFSIAIAGDMYFPPLTGSDWQTISPESLNWNTSKIDDLYKFLAETNSKAFIMLKDGKIVLEKYFGSFTKDSLWYWASAGKTLTSALVGIAQEEGLLKINEKTSKYLGKGWTSCPVEKEDKISIWNQLTMTTGLDYKVEDLDCTDPECLKYRADAGTQWYYHNAPYTLLQKVVEKATALNYNLYFSQKIRNQIGMNGAWVKLGYNNIYFSNARSMARYGILIANNGYWENKDIIKDKEYLNQMINTSQELNKSYGYLWWLNGKESYLIPGTTKVFNGSAMPDAPSDMYAALGKNGQILNVVPSKGMILVRMGDRPDDQFFISNIFNNDIWKYLNEIIDGKTSVNEANDNFIITPNPASDYIEISFSLVKEQMGFDIQIYNLLGMCVLTSPFRWNSQSEVENVRLDVSHLLRGVYYIRIGSGTEMFVKM